jgi:DNA-binding MarR family transcriptional regulator
MEQHPPSDPEVQGWLYTLGVASLCQWHVLLFLCRHQTTLLGAEYLAHLLGYATEAVVAALDALEARGLVERSRVSQGARLYKLLAPLVSPGGEAFAQLQALASDSAGRRRIYTQLRQGDRTAGEMLQQAQRFIKNTQKRVQETKRRMQQLEERKPRWRKAM